MGFNSGFKGLIRTHKTDKIVQCAKEAVQRSQKKSRRNITCNTTKYVIIITLDILIAL